MRIFNKKKNRRFTDQVDQFTTRLAVDAEFIGDLQSSENIRVDGRVKGSADVRGALVVGPQCSWQGNISADVIIVEGRVDGDITAGDRLELLSGARVTGDISCTLITMEVGATCEGQIHMQDDMRMTSFKEQRVRK